MPVTMQELSKMRSSAVRRNAGRVIGRMAASKAARLGVVLALGLVGSLAATPASALAATTSLVSTSTSAPGGGTVGSGTSLTVNFNEAPSLASSYGLTLTDGPDVGTLSTADGNLSANVSGNSITFTATHAPAMSTPGSLSLGSPLEILSATGVSDSSGNPWNLIASGEVDKFSVLSNGDSVVVTYTGTPTLTVQPTFSLALAEGSMQASIDQSNVSTPSVSGDTVTYDLKGNPSGVVPTDPPTVTNFTGVTGATGVASTCDSDGSGPGTGTDPCVHVNVDVATTCSDNNLNVTRVFNGSNCSISNNGPVAPDVFDVIALPTDDLPGPHPTNGDPAGDDNAPEVITNCETNSTDFVYDVNTGAELGYNACGNNPNETAIGNTNGPNLDYISTPNLASFEEAGVVETIPGSNYVSPTAVPPQLSSIVVNGSHATFNYYTPVVCQNNGSDSPDNTYSQFSYTSPYTDENHSDRVYPTGLSCPSGSPTSSGSNSIVVTYPGTIPTRGAVQVRGLWPGPVHHRGAR